MKKCIYINTQFEGFHCWPEAPDEVLFLRNLHRHIFKVKVVVRVHHLARQVEFFILKREIDRFLQNGLMMQLENDPSMSCETMAERIYKNFMQYYSLAQVEVSEDGENGAIIFPEF